MKKTDDKLRRIAQRIRKCELELEKPGLTSHEKGAIEEKLYDLRTECFQLKGPDYTDGIVDIVIKNKAELVNKNANAVLKCAVHLHGELEEIGMVEINLNNGESLRDHGNINYSFIGDYEKKGYALRALKLLSELMIQCKLERPIMVTSKENFVGNGTIRLFGGVPDFDTLSIGNQYVVDLKRK